MFCPKCGTDNPETGKFCRSCGTDIGVVSKALERKSFAGVDHSDEDDYSMTEYDDDGKKLKTPEDFFGNGVKEICGGIAFIAIAAILFFTNIIGGSVWGFWLLIPGGYMIGNGISSIYKSKKMEERMGLSSGGQQNVLDRSNVKADLPPTQTDYIPPEGDVKYETGDLVPPSVTEGTTRHLKMDSESETMTLPEKKS